MMGFYKYEGTGNDFILIEDFDAKARKSKDFVIRMCDRHFGIGADGILYVQEPEEGKFHMKLLNSDSSEAEMCGNGIRCVAKHLYDSGLVEGVKFEISTLAGKKQVEVKLGKDGLAESAIVGMGKPEFQGELDVLGEHLVNVSMGNPHAVMFKQKIDMAEVNEKGPKIENDAHFPKRTNVEFAHVKNDHEIELVVYERGAGLTLACGTGACATVAAAARAKLVKTGVPVSVQLPGGVLKVTIDASSSQIVMEGPAKLVFSGEMEI